MFWAREFLELGMFSFSTVEGAGGADTPFGRCLSPLPAEAHHVGLPLLPPRSAVITSPSAPPRLPVPHKVRVREVRELCLNIDSI